MTDRELWAAANHVHAQHGEEAGRIFIAARIGELALRSDGDGICAWKLIAAYFDKLVADPTHIE